MALQGKALVGVAGRVCVCGGGGRGIGHAAARASLCSRLASDLPDCMCPHCKAPCLMLAAIVTATCPPPHATPCPCPPSSACGQALGCYAETANCIPPTASPADRVGHVRLCRHHPLPPTPAGPSPAGLAPCLSRPSRTASIDARRASSCRRSSAAASSAAAAPWRAAAAASCNSEARCREAARLDASSASSAAAACVAGRTTSARLSARERPPSAGKPRCLPVPALPPLRLAQLMATTAAGQPLRASRTARSHTPAWRVSGPRRTPPCRREGWPPRPPARLSSRPGAIWRWVRSCRQLPLPVPQGSGSSLLWTPQRGRCRCTAALTPQQASQA